MAKAKNETAPKVLAAFDAMIAAVPTVERKGATTPYTSLNGNMYASISKANVIGLRLSKSDLVDFLERYQNGLYEGVPGHFMKEYAAMPAALFDDVGDLQAWFVKSHAYVSGLKPKKTTR
jgi:hypothetical protein